MHRFAVWAPTPTRVDLVVDEHEVAAAPVGGGWWEARAEKAVPGSRYGYRLDAGPVLADPRSPSQPDGPAGRSELIDHGAFAWSDAAWRGVSLRGAVLYELHVGTFSAAGTFDGAVANLDHLVDLGVDTVELLPVAEFPGDRGWGYDAVDLYAPHHVYGGPNGLKRLVDACHARGLGVVLDVVYNHLGPSGNHLREFGPYFSEHHHTNWGDAVNFDGPGSDEVRRFVIDNALGWFRHYHVDGLRLDAVHAIVDDSARHVLEELAGEVDALATQLHRPRFLVAESDRNDPRLIRAREAGGYGLDAVWADEWHHALHAALTGERSGYYEDFGPLALLAKALRQAWVYDGSWSPHRQRHHGASPAGLAGYRFVVSTQNHDQVGNRAAGERLAALTSPGRLRVAAALLLCAPFTPLLFQGEEWAASSPFAYFTDHHDPAVAKAVTDGRRSEFAAFGWKPDDVPDPQAAETYEASKLHWGELTVGDHATMLDWYRRLLCLRHEVPALADPRPTSVAVHADECAGTLLVTRATARLLVNLGDRAHRFDTAGPVALLACSDDDIRVEDTAVVVPPDAVAIVEMAHA